MKNDYDSAEVNYIKKMLQFELPIILRKKIINHLFSKYVSIDEFCFAEELYMSKEQLSLMVDTGMHVGSHGDQHLWLEYLDAQSQILEISRSLNFIESIGMNKNVLTISYPFGSFNSETLKIVESMNFKLGFTTRVGASYILNENRFIIPRFDTNDMPK